MVKNSPNLVTLIRELFRRQIDIVHWSTKEVKALLGIPLFAVPEKITVILLFAVPKKRLALRFFVVPEKNEWHSVFCSFRKKLMAFRSL
jgi:hypothetical protein